jgi:hypothetical protein
MPSNTMENKTLQLCKIMRGEQITKFWALKNISMVQTEQELLFFGKYGEDKIARTQ